MGSHRARHRSDQKQSEELATDLLARLAAEARPARTRRATPPPLDPFATAPFPARPPRAATQNLLLASSGATRCAGMPHGGVLRRAGEDHASRLTAQATVERFPTDPAAPFPIDGADADLPAGLSPGDVVREAPQTGRTRRASLRGRPLYATMSATVITATAAVAASAGPVSLTPAHATPDLPTASTSPAGATALDLTLPTPSPTPVGAQTLGGPAALLAPDPAPVQGSAIAAGAVADAKAYAAQQAALAALSAGRAQNTVPAHVPHPTPQAPAPKPKVAPAPKPAAPRAASAGSGVGARALTLAKSKLGDPYVWGAAGPNAFDCSGIVVWAFKQLGIMLPHSSATLSTMGSPVSKAALQPGDLVFFYSPVSHVGIYAGNGTVLNATESGQPVQYSKLAYLPFHNARRITV